MFGKKTWKIVFEQTQNVNFRRMFLHRTATDAREEAVDYTADGQEPGGCRGMGTPPTGV